MMIRFMRGLGRMVIGHPGWVAGSMLALTLFFFANIHNLRTGTELTECSARMTRSGKRPARSARNWATATSFLCWSRPRRATPTPAMRWKRRPTG